jgi:molybdopterin biosynthesis enzyme
MKMQNQIIKTKTANMLHSYSKNPNLTQLRRAFVNEKGIKIIPDQESYKINSLVKANAWIILDQKTKLIKRGEKVKYIEYEN